jgi:glycosyltransferase involved in cell wall biosynthesis
MKTSLFVSAVIPTRGRSEQVVRAVRTALDQTYSNIEVVVVVDGPDPGTLDALSNVHDSRLRVTTLAQSVGGASARNAGVEAAQGEWIAFLDDDDEWLPSKIERQLKRAANCACTEPIVSCRFTARTNGGEQAWPVRLPGVDEGMSDYLLVRSGAGRTEGFVATPTILARRSLLLRVPFTAGLKRHQDWDWVLRATREPKVQVVFCPEVLAICNMQSDDSISRNADWRLSLDWIRRMKPLVSERAYASFLTCHVAWQAAVEHAWPVFFPLLAEAATSGSLRPGDLARYAGFWFTPRPLRQWVKQKLSLPQ